MSHAGRWNSLIGNPTAPLAWFGALSVPVAIACAVAVVVDPRTLDGAPVWVKPLKFTISNALFAATLAWMLRQLVRPAAFVSRVAMTVALLLGLENVLISVQAGRGVHSHFNARTAFDIGVVSTMGISITVVMVLLVMTAVAFSRQRVGDPLRLSGIRLGLAITIAGASIGGMMTVPRPNQLAHFSRQHGGTVGAHSVGGPDGGAVVGPAYWSADHGDLRPAHFIGLHAMQVLPLLAMALSRTKPPLRQGRALLRLGAATYGTFMMLLCVQALRGEPVLHPDRTIVASALMAIVVSSASAFALATRQAREIVT